MCEQLPQDSTHCYAQHNALQSIFINILWPEQNSKVFANISISILIQISMKFGPINNQSALVSIYVIWFYAIR